MRYLIYILSLVAVLALGSLETFAANGGSTLQFTGAYSTAWNNKDNWNPKQVPGNGDDVVIPADKHVVVTGSVTVSTLTVNGTLEIVGNVTILVSRSNNSDKSDYIVINGNLVLNGGTLQAKSNGGSAKDNVDITANGSISGSGDIVGSNFVIDPKANLGDFIPGNNTPDILKNAVSASRPAVIYVNGTCVLRKGVKCDYAFKDAACTQSYIGAVDFSKRIYIVGGNVSINEATDISGTLVVNAGLLFNAAVNFNGTGLKLEVDPGADVRIASAVVIKDGGQIVVNHRYDRSASLYVANGGSLSPNRVAVNHTIKAGRTYYMGASTVDGEPVALEANASDKYYKYVAAQEEFVLADAGREFSEAHRTGSVWLKKGATAERTISENGALQIEDRSYSLSLTAGKEYGWNLLSNPFSTAIDLSGDQFDFVPEEINPTIWCRVKQGGQYQFLTHSLATGVSTPEDSDGEWSGSFAPQQTFYVKAYREGASFTIKRPNEPRAGATLKSAKTGPKDVLRLSLASEEYNRDEMAMVFREGGEIDEAYGDAEKRQETADYNAIYALKGSNKCAIPFYPTASEVVDIELPIGIRLSARSMKGEIEAINVEEFAETAQAYLVDKKEQAVIDLMSTSRYEFESEAGVTDEERFVIVLGNKSVDVSEESEEEIMTGVEDIRKGGEIVPLAGGVIVKHDGGAEAVLRLYDASGRLVDNVKIKEQHVFLPIAKRGLYVAELTSGNGVERVKVLVK